MVLVVANSDGVSAWWYIAVVLVVVYYGVNC